MGLFSSKKRTPELLVFPPEDYEPVLRCSICTGERVACMRERSTGRLREMMLIRTEADLDTFCESYHVAKEKLKKVY